MKLTLKKMPQIFSFNLACGAVRYGDASAVFHYQRAVLYAAYVVHVNREGRVGTDEAAVGHKDRHRFVKGHA